MQILVFDATAAPVTYNMCAKLASQTIDASVQTCDAMILEKLALCLVSTVAHTYTHRTLQTVVPSNDGASEGGRRGSFLSTLLMLQNKGDLCINLRIKLL